MRVQFPSLVDPRVALTVKAEVVVPKSGTEKQTTRYRVGPAIYLSRQAQLKNVESRSKKDSLSIWNARKGWALQPKRKAANKYFPKRVFIS